MKAMILAAGLGSRMHPLTDTTPKPLLKVAGKSLLDWALDRISETDCDHVIVNVHYLGEQIEAHLKNHRKLRTSIITEDPVLETGGGVKNALDKGLLGPDPFYVCNADNLWRDGPGQSALARLAQAWDDNTMDGLLLVQDIKTANGYDGNGDFECPNSPGPLRRCQHKTVQHNTTQPAFVFTGVQILHPRLFANAPQGSFSLNVLYDAALAQGRLHGLPHAGTWHHVGTPQALTATNATFTTAEV